MIKREEKEKDSLPARAKNFAKSFQKQRLSRNPIFQVVLVFHRGSTKKKGVGGREKERIAKLGFTF